MVPIAMYRQERTRIESGRLPKFMATPPAPQHLVPVLRDLAAPLPPPQEVPESYSRNLLCRGANRCPTRRQPTRTLSPNTPVISTPGSGGTAVSPASFLHSR